MEFDINFYDIIFTSTIGIFLVSFGLHQIKLEKSSYGMIGYTFHRVYTSIGLLQLCNTIRLWDYYNETIRIVTQWFLDLQSMFLITGLLIFNAYIQILSKNILSNSLSINWNQLDKVSRYIHYFFISITVINSNVATVLRFIYRYEFWTFLIILSNITCLSYTTISLHYHLHHFFKNTEIVMYHMNKSNEYVTKAICNMYILRIIYTITIIPVFYFLALYTKQFLTTNTFHLQNFNNHISYFRYIILFSSIILAWITYIKKNNMRVSPVIVPRKTSDTDMQSVFVL